jgi:hypothetical protein
MILGRFLLTALVALGTASAATAADHCISRAEQRARAAAHGVVSLSRAMRAVHKRGEVIHARLCERNGHLVYLLTVLDRDGKVAQTSVDAANGTVVGAHPHDKSAKDKAVKAAKDKDAKDRDAKDRDAKDKAVKDKDAKDRDAKKASKKAPK